MGTPARLDSSGGPARVVVVRDHGGQMFETETVLGPFGDPADEDAGRVTDTDVLGRNRWYVQSGLGPDRSVFHEGLGVTFADLVARRYVVVENTSPFAVHATFDTLQLWYEGWIRAEYRPEATDYRHEASTAG